MPAVRLEVHVDRGPPGGEREFVWTAWPERDAGQRLAERDLLHYDDFVELRVPALGPHLERNLDALNVAMIGVELRSGGLCLALYQRSISLVSALIENSKARPPLGVC